MAKKDVKQKKTPAEKSQKFKLQLPEFLQGLSRETLINLGITSVVALFVFFSIGYGALNNRDLFTKALVAKQAKNKADIENQTLKTRLKTLEIDVDNSVVGVSQSQQKADTKLIETSVKDNFAGKTPKAIKKAMLTSDVDDKTKAFVSKVAPDDGKYNGVSVKAYGDSADVKVYPLEWKSNGDVTYRVIVNTSVTLDAKKVTEKPVLMVFDLVAKGDGDSRQLVEWDMRTFAYMKKGLTHVEENING